MTGNVTAARSSEWAQHFSNASCSVNQSDKPTVTSWNMLPVSVGVTLVEAAPTSIRKSMSWQTCYIHSSLGLIQRCHGVVDPRRRTTSCNYTYNNTRWQYTVCTIAHLRILCICATTKHVCTLQTTKLNDSIVGLLRQYCFYYHLWMYVLTLSHVLRLWAVIGARWEPFCPARLQLISVNLYCMYCIERK